MGLIHEAPIEAAVTTERQRCDDFLVAAMAINTTERHRFVVVHGVAIGLGMTGNTARTLRIGLRLTLMPRSVFGLDIFALDRLFTFTGQSSTDPQEDEQEKLE